MPVTGRARRSGLFAAVVLCAGASSSLAVNHLSYDQLVSLVLFEDENAYLNPTAFFCRFIALQDGGDFCKVTITTLDPKLCKVEVTRDIQATVQDGKAREFMRSRDVFVLANLDLAQLKEPEVDDERKTSRQSFRSQIDIKWHEGFHFTYALDDRGGYNGCIVDGVEKDLTQAACASAGQEPYGGTKSMSLIFNTDTYNRSMAALRWLQKEHCPKGEDL